MDEQMMRPTVPWMREKFDEFNKLLFNGELGPCEFKVFTTGKGSRGHRLGNFSLTGVSGFFISKSTRQMYRPLPNGQRLYVDEGNFAELCKPVIGMNGNYMATEEALCATLVHEMCHYYVYMNGFYPVHAHGSEFKFIADNVGVRSNGRFSVQRLATAEEMANRVLDKDIAHRNKNAMDRRNENSMLIFVFKNDGVVNMTRISVNNKSALNTILNYYSKPQNMKLVDKIIASTDQRLIKLVNDLGFRTIMRKPKFWNVSSTGFADHVRNGAYKCDVLLSESTQIGRIIESVISEYISSL